MYVVFIIFSSIIIF